MSFEPFETEYSRDQKRSDHRMRRFSAGEKEEKEKGRPMEGYESSEQERKEKKEPAQQVLLKGGRNRFSAGYNREKKLTMVFSRDKQDGDGKEEEVLKRERSSSWKGNKKYFLADLAKPEQGAMALEDREEKQKKFLMKQISDAADGPEESLVQEEFSFFSTRNERRQIRMLEDEARKHSLDRETVEENRRQASALAQDVMHKEQERRDFAKQMASQLSAEKGEKQHKAAPLYSPLLHGMQAPDGAEGEGEKNGTEDPEENKEGKK